MIDGTIRTFTGRLFRPLDPASGEIEIRDKAEAQFLLRFLELYRRTR